MSDVEPEKVNAIRDGVARELGLGQSDVELEERAAPGSSDDEPYFVTVRVPRKDWLDDGKIDAAVRAVEARSWQHPAHPWQLRWEWKDAAS